MSSTTLVTFLFEGPASARAARSVELLGSWDNFHKPYRMKRDLKKGSCFWTGCFSFQEIICDGDPTNLSQRRNGALMMGGTYWYYYRIDDDEEYHDTLKPSTTFCPLLPGQRLNILEVPTQSKSRSGSVSSTTSGIHTLNPDDKFLNPKPPVSPIPSHAKSYNDIETSQTRPHPMLVTSTGKVLSHPRSAGSGCYARPRQISSQRERLVRLATDSSNMPVKIEADYQYWNHLSDAGCERQDFEKVGRPLDREWANHTRPRSVQGIKPPTGTDTSRWRTSNDQAFLPWSAAEISWLSTPSSKSMRSFETRNVPPSSSYRSLHKVRSYFAAHFSDHESRPTGRVRAQSLTSMRNCATATDAKSCSRADSAPCSGTGFAEDELLHDSIARFKGFRESSKIKCSHSPVRTLLPLSTTSSPPSRRKMVVSSVLHGFSESEMELPDLSACLRSESLRVEDYDLAKLDETRCNGAMTQKDPSGVFSLWSVGSLSCTSPISDEDDLHSPTFSSLTTSSGDANTPGMLFVQHFDEYPSCDPSQACESSNDQIDRGEKDGHYSFCPPTNVYSSFDRMDQSCIDPRLLQYTNGPYHHQPWRFDHSQDFDGYNMRAEQTTSQVTLTKSSIYSQGFLDEVSIPKPQLTDSDTPVNHLERLMSEFGFLGEAVL